MTTGYVEKSLELQIADLFQRKLEEKFGDFMSFGPIRVKERDDLNGELYLHVYIVCDGDYDRLDYYWTGILSRRFEPELRAIGVTQFVLHSFIDKSEWPWFSKAEGFDC